MANNEFDIINEPVKAVEIGYNRVESFVEKNKKNLLKLEQYKQDKQLKKNSKEQDLEMLILVIKVL